MYLDIIENLSQKEINELYSEILEGGYKENIVSNYWYIVCENGRTGYVYNWWYNFTHFCFRAYECLQTSEIICGYYCGTNYNCVYDHSPHDDVVDHINCTARGFTEC